MAGAGMIAWCTGVARTGHEEQGSARSEECGRCGRWYVQGAGQALALESMLHHELFRVEVLEWVHLDGSSSTRERAGIYGQEREPVSADTEWSRGWQMSTLYKSLLSW